MATASLDDQGNALLDLSPHRAETTVPPSFTPEQASQRCFDCGFSVSLPTADSQCVKVICGGILCTDTAGCDNQAHRTQSQCTHGNRAATNHWCVPSQSWGDYCGFEATAVKFVWDRTEGTSVRDRTGFGMALGSIQLDTGNSLEGLSKTDQWTNAFAFELGSIGPDWVYIKANGKYLYPYTHSDGSIFAATRNNENHPWRLKIVGGRAGVSEYTNSGPQNQAASFISRDEERWAKCPHGPLVKLCTEVNEQGCCMGYNGGLTSLKCYTVIGDPSVIVFQLVRETDLVTDASSSKMVTTNFCGAAHPG